MFARIAKLIIEVVPGELSRTNATQMSAPRCAITTFRRYPAALPYFAQSAGCRSTSPPNARHTASAM